MATTTARAPESQLGPASFAGAFAYEHTDIPAGITLAEHGRGHRIKRYAQHQARCQRVLRAVNALARWLASQRVTGVGR